MDKQLPDVVCRFGAPMGRPSDPECRGEVRLFRVVLTDGYDDGGAYWGLGEPLYCIEGDDVRAFTRTADRIEAMGEFAIRYPDIRFKPLDHEDVLSEMLDGYATAAIWSSTDDDGDYLDAEYGVDDIDDSTLERMKEDCRRFIDLAWDVIGGPVNLPPDCTMWEYAGHDFWLTRNGHGAGFWDGDWPHEVGEALTRASKSFPETHLYVHDGKIHQE